MIKLVEELITLDELKKSFKVVKTEQNFVFIKSGKYTAKIRLPLEPSPELASLFGHALGDSHIKKNGEQFQYFNKNKELVNYVANCIEQIFHIQPIVHFRKDSEVYCLYASSIVSKVLNMLGAPAGRKTTQDFILPYWLTSGSLEIKRAFIRALFDDEGWVGITQSSFAIGFGQNKLENWIDGHLIYMHQIRALLKEFGIETSEIYQRAKQIESIQLGLKIIGPENIKKFSENIGFNHKQKQEKLLTILRSYKQIQFGKKEAKSKILETLQKYGPLKSRKLGLLLNRDQKTIWKHLHKLTEKGLVTKIGTKNKVFWEFKNSKTI